jgi:hypothetical protein
MPRKASKMPAIGELGALKVRMAVDEAAEKTLRDEILRCAAAEGNDAPEGARFRALVVRSERSVFDIKAQSWRWDLRRSGC